MKCSQVEYPGDEFVTRFCKWSEVLAPGVQVWDFKDGSGHVVTKQVLCGKDTGYYCGMCGHMIKPHRIWLCECGEMEYAEYHHLGLIQLEESTAIDLHAFDLKKTDG